MLSNINYTRLFVGKSDKAILKISLIILSFFTLSISIAQAETISGTFQMQTGDPSPESGLKPIFEFVLFDDTGKNIQLQLDKKVIEQVGGISAINGKRVSVNGAWTTTGSTITNDEASILETPHMLEVESISIEKNQLILPDAFDAQPSSQLIGPQPWISILCRFADSTSITPRPKTYFESLMGEEEPGMGHYWPTTSYGNINISGSEVHGWYDLPENRDAYLTSTNQLNLHKVANACADVADADVNFNNFEGVNFFFNSLSGSAWGGRTTLSADNKNTIRTTWMPTWAYTRDPGVIAHEMGHALGLPHSSGPYSATYDSKWDPLSNAYSNWNCPNRHNEYQCIPVHTISAHKDRLNWISEGKIYTADPGTTQTINLERLAQPGTSGFLMAKIPIRKNVYYTVEARKRIGYDLNIPGDAIIIHKVEPYRERWAQVVDGTLNGDPNDQGAMWTEDETFHDPESGVIIKVEATTTTGYYITITGPTLWNYQYEEIPYQWIDTSNGNKVTFNTNQSIQSVSMGFNFKFYGQSYDKFVVAKNGALTFENHFSNTHWNFPLPDNSPAGTNALIAPFWDMLDPSEIYTLLEGTTPNRRLTVSWISYPKSISSNLPISFQATLYESTDEIVFRYKNTSIGNNAFDYGASANIGIEGLFGKTALQYSYRQPILENESSIKFYREIDNYPPRLSTLEDKIAYETKKLTVDFSATDADGIPPTLTANLNDLPEGNNASFTDYGDGTGQLVWAPLIGDNDVIPYTISITATDTEDSRLMDIQNFEISVKRKNLLLNESFEPPFAGWRFSADNITRSKTNSHFGEYSVKLIGDPTKYSPKASQFVDIIAGHNYQFGGWINVRGITTGRYVFVVQWYNNWAEISGSRQVFGATEVNTAYAFKSIEIVAPKEATRVLLTLQANKTDGIAHYDDLIITDLTIFGTGDTDAPSIPTDLQASAINSSQITLRWNPSSDVDGIVAGYNIFRNRDSTPIATVTDGTTYSDTGLTANTTYVYTVSAFDNASPTNESVVSSQASATTLPVSTNLLLNGDFELGNTNSWVTNGANANLGNAKTGNYSLAIKGNPTGYPKASQKVPVTAGNTYRFYGWMEVVGLTKGKYIFQVRWFSASGAELGGTRTSFGIMEADTVYNDLGINLVAPVGAAKAMLLAQANKADGTAYYDDLSITDITGGGTDTQPPTVPQNSEAAANSASQITVDWEPSTDNGGGSVAGYNIYRDGDSTPTATVVGTTFVDTSLTPNTTYSYTISAFDDASPANESAKSSAVSATTPPLVDVDAPTVPQNLNATATSATQINLSWDASTDNGGGVVAGYKVFRDGNNPAIATVTNGTSYNDTGLTANTTYVYTVSAFDNASPTNESVVSTQASATTLPVSTNLLLNADFELGNTNSWITNGANANLGNAKTGNYSLAIKGNPIGYPKASQKVPVTAGNTYRFYGWMEVVGRTTGKYIFQVRWFSATGSELKGTRTSFGIMEANTVYNDLGINLVAPAGAAKAMLLAQANKADGTAYYDDLSITDLTGGGTDTQPPTVPQNLSATAVSSSQINLSWEASTDIGGGTVAGYKIFRDGNSTPIATVTDGESYSDTGLTANTTYVYTVSAFDNASPTNESVVSTQDSATTLPVSTNLLLNVDFELGNTNSWLTNGAVANLGNAKTGSYSLAIVGNPSGYPKASQKVPVTAGNTYRFQGWMEVVGRTTGKYIFQVRWFSATGAEIGGMRTTFGLTEVNTPYAEHIKDIVAPTNAAKAMLVLQANKADGTGYYDSLGITSLN